MKITENWIDAEKKISLALNENKTKKVYTIVSRRKHL